MRPHAYFVGLSLAGLLVGNPAQWLADDNSVNSGNHPTNSMVDGTALRLMNLLSLKVKLRFLPSGNKSIAMSEARQIPLRVNSLICMFFAATTK